MRKFLIVLTLALLLGAVVYQILSAQQGYLLLSAGSYVIETTLWGALVSLVLLLLALYLLVRIWQAVLFPRRWWRSRRGKKKTKLRDRTAQGVIDYLEGNWPKAVENLTGATDSETPGVNYLGAAAASFHLGEEAQCRSLLAEAEEKDALDALALGLMRTRLSLQAGEYEKALAQVEQLHRKVPSHPTVLRLLVEARRGTADWRGLESLLPDLKKHRALSPKELEALEIETYRELIGAFAATRSTHPSLGEQQSELDHLWDRVPGHLKQNSVLVAAFVNQLRLLGLPEKAEQRLRRFVGKHWDDDLARLYGDIEADAGDQLKHAESWLKQHPDNPALLETLGRLCVRCELWGKGKEYYEMVLKKNPQPRIWLALGLLLEKLGEPESGARYYRQGLEQLAGTDAASTGQ